MEFVIQNFFGQGYLKYSPNLAVECTFDLNPKDKSVYFNRIDSWVTHKGYGAEVANHLDLSKKKNA